MRSTEKVASPCKRVARVSTGSTVNLQLLAPEPRVTVIFLASTPVASPHEMSYDAAFASEAWLKALICKV